MSKHVWSQLSALTAVALVAVANAGHAQGAGDTVVCLEVASGSAGEKGDVDIYAQRVTQAGKLLWNNGEPLAVATARDLESSPAVCEDGAGGAIVAYTYEFVEGEHKGDVDIVAQRLGKSGKLLWNEGKSPVPVASSKGKEAHPLVVSDGHGGAIVVYEWTNAQGDTDVLAQRITGNGKLVWNGGEKPAVVGASGGIERSPVVVPDGQGGVIVFFEWQGDNGDVDVMAQRVSAEGKVMWNTGERAVDVASSKSIERHVTAVSDGRGGAIAAFEVEFTEGENRGDVDIMAQRISGDGVLGWNDGKGSSDVSTGKGIERNPTAISDGAGGILVAFEYEPREGEFAGDIDILAQRLNGDGQMMWNKGEVSTVVSSAKGLERLPRAVPSGNGGAVIVFESAYRGGDNAGDVDVLAQRVSAAGELLWDKGERSSVVAASKWRERAPVALPDGRGGVIVVYPGSGPPGEFENDLDVMAMRLDGDGKMLWNAGEKAVDIAAGKAVERNPCAVMIGSR